MASQPFLMDSLKGYLCLLKCDVYANLEAASSHLFYDLQAQNFAR
jgi:hypothetical protein